MGGVDRADQMAGVYELDRKSLKWWEKVLYRMSMVVAVNSWIIYKQLKCNRSKMPFLVELAEELIHNEKKGWRKMSTQRWKTTKTFKTYG